MRPVTLLLSLLLGASVGGAWVYASYQRFVFEQQAADGRDGPSIAGESSSAGVSADVAQLNKDLAFYKDQVALLKKENENLNLSVKKLSTSVGGAPGAAGPTGQPTGFSPASLVRDIEAIRELTFAKPPTFVRVPVTGLEQKIRAALLLQVSEGEARVRERAAKAIGLASDPFNYVDAMTGLTLEQAGGYYDAATNELFIDEAADFEKRVDLKGRLVKEIAYALVKSHFADADLSEFDSFNDDRALAARAFILGDAVATKIHFGLVDALNNDYSRSQNPVAQTAFAGAPLFLRELFLFPFMMGSSFTQELSQAGGPKALNDVYDRPPLSTAEILHSEAYSASPPFKAVAVPWRDVLVGDTIPFSDNVLGEFGLYILFKRRVPEDEAFEAGRGWIGDRYVCYPGDEKLGDHVFWRTLWQTEKDAAEFAKSAQTVWLHRYAIPWNKRYEQPDGAFVINDPHRLIRIRIGGDKKTVDVLDATDAAMANAMEAKLGVP